MKLELAILTILARRPDRRASFDEVARELNAVLEDGGSTARADRFDVLAQTDIVRNGLISCDDAGLQITAAGLSLLSSLDGASSISAAQPSALIDNLVTPAERARMFELDLRPARPDVRGSRRDTTDRTVAIGNAERLPHRDGTDRDPQGSNRELANASSDTAQYAPEFIKRSAFGAGIRGPIGESSIFAYIATKTRAMMNVWRSHLAKGRSNEKIKKPVRGIGGPALLLFCLLLVVGIAGAAIAVTQINALKSEISTLQRELFPLRDRLAKMEKLERANKAAEPEDKSSDARPKLGTDGRAEQTGVTLSQEEIQLVRAFISAAPVPGQPAPSINVGDVITGTTIPLPPQLTDKVPKLSGGKFTIRNGAIIIIGKDSRGADVVVPSN